MRIDSNTKLLGLIGHPVAHSLSPAMHNAVFEKLKLNCVYLAFDVSEGNLKHVLSGANAIGVIGLNVTIPHKINVMRHLDSISREARLIGAVNTIKFEKNKAIGFNTDGIGCVRALNESVGKIKGKRILLLGAGGAARAISFQSVMYGAKLSISNRKIEKHMAFRISRDIKKKLRKKVDVVDLSIKDIKEKLSDTDILINSTPVGMHPNVNGSIIPANIIPKNVVVMDIVYNPVETKLLRDAKKRGCKTVDGLGMLANQGAEALKIWLGIRAPVGLMRRVALKGLMK